MAAAFSRRRLLRVSAASGALLTAGWLAGRMGWVDLVTGGGAARYQVASQIAGRLRVLGAKEYSILQAVARRVLDGAEPAVSSAGGQDGVDVALWADGYLASLDPALQRDVLGLLQIVEHGNLTPQAGAGRFTALSAAAQDQLLGEWQHSRLALRRQGFQALKAICCLAYYQDARAFAAIGYSGPLVPRRWEGP